MAQKIAIVEEISVNACGFSNFAYLCHVNSKLRPWLKDQRVDTKIMIQLYYVNRVAQPTGEHEVHTSTCRYLPSAANRIFLGYFSNSRDALQAARMIYSNVDGCFYCCSDSHHR